jgi:uncharacterized protein (TIGR01319 family)
MRRACVDVGSTWTKAALVGPEGDLLGTGAHPTTLADDVMRGVRAAVAEAGGDGRDALRICSSAGGGLRLAVIGYERAVTAEAGRRVGLSAGARVHHVASGRLDDGALDDLLAAGPDVVLLAGGTDGGDAEVLLANAAALARRRCPAPVVLAGNAEARGEAEALLRSGGVDVQPTANVLPAIGHLDPRPAREAIRSVFLRHVIGGKHLSADPAFARAVRCATPDAVLAGVELLADGAGAVAGLGQVLVVDVGGATTDVYSVVEPDAEEGALHREVVEPMWRERTVEGDLGVRWGAPGVVEAAESERLLRPGEAGPLTEAARRRAAEPEWVPAAEDEEGRDLDRRLGILAGLIALRRHGRASLDGDVRRPAKDLSGVRLVVASGGVFRHLPAAEQPDALAALLDDAGGGWRAPERVPAVVDRRYVLAAAGLLAAEAPEAAARLLAEQLGALAL